MKKILKLVVGLLLMGLLIRQLDIESLAGVFGKTRVGHLLAALAFFVLASLAEILRLFNLLSSFCSLAQVARVVYIGLFFNNFLPTNVGGDAYKVFSLKSDSLGFDRATTLVVLDRTVGAAVLLAAGAVYSMINWPLFVQLLEKMQLSVSRPGLSLMIAGSLVGIAVIVLVIGYLTGLGARVTAGFCRVLKILRDVPRRVFTRQIMMTLCYHLCRVVAIYFLLMSFGQAFVWHQLILVLSVVAFAALLPVSLGGLGVREGVLAGGLILLGVEKNVAISVALINLLILWTKAAIGGLVFLAGRRDQKQRA